MKISNDRPTVAEVVDKLAALGSGQQIAQFFEERGIVGSMGWSDTCPVANYIRRETGRWVQAGIFTVSSPGVFAVEEGAFTLDVKDQVALPEPIMDFIVDFDRGKYPRLVKHGQS